MEKSCVLKRDEIYALLKKNHICARKYFYPIVPELACYRNQYERNTLKTAKGLAEKVLVLPLYEGMGIKTVKQVSKIIKSTIIEKK